MIKRFYLLLALTLSALSLRGQYFNRDSIKNKTDTFFINGHSVVFEPYEAYNNTFEKIFLLNDTGKICLLTICLFEDDGDEFSKLHEESFFEMKDDRFIIYDYKSIDGYVVNGRPPTDIWTKEIYVLRKNGELVCLSRISGNENSIIRKEVNLKLLN